MKDSLLWSSRGRSRRQLKLLAIRTSPFVAPAYIAMLKTDFGKVSIRFCCILFAITFDAQNRKCCTGLVADLYPRLDASKQAIRLLLALAWIPADPNTVL
jgi:hypothetical protein